MNKEHKRTLKNAVDVCPIWSMGAANKIHAMLDQIDQANSLLDRISSTQQNVAVKGGFAAETWHAETFNLDAILKDKTVRAFTDNFKGNHGLKKNDSVHDLVVMDGDQRILTVQSKYYGTPKKTANALREYDKTTKKFKYEENDVFLTPSDQTSEIKSLAQKDIETQQHRPRVAKGAEQVKNKASDKIAVDDVESKVLTKKEAEHLGNNSEAGQKMHKEMQQSYLNKSTVQQSLRAAKNAAIITTVIAGTINSIEHINKARTGKISSEEAVRAIITNTVAAAGDSALKAGVATAAVSTAAQHFPNLFTGTIFQQSLASGGIAGASICAIDLVQCTVLFALGKMTKQELEERTGKNIFQTGSAVVGSSIGASIGVIGGPPGMLIGSILGGIITGLATTIAIDNGIEKPFKQALTSTENLISLGNTINDSLMYLSISQTYYKDFQIGLFLSEKEFNNRTIVMKKQSLRLKDKLAKF